MRVTASATYKGKTNRVHFDNIDTDSEAMMAAIPKILDLAYTREVWAMGEITLTDAADGRIIAIMPPKD